MKVPLLVVVASLILTTHAVELRSTDYKTITDAIAACHAAGGGRVIVPKGKWVTGAVHFKSHVELHLETGAELVFTDDPNDYLPAVETSWEGMECISYSPLIYAYGCTNVALTGRGTLAPRLAKWEEWVPPHGPVAATRRQLYMWGATNEPVSNRNVFAALAHPNLRPQLVQFNRCQNVRLEDFKVRGSPFWTIHLYLCDGVVARGLDVFAHGSNNDGIDLEMTRNALIEDCRFDQGDDGIVIKSGRNRDGWRLNTPTENITIRRCEIANAHTLLGIGSEISGGVRNIRLENCTGGNVNRIIYIKTNHRRGAFVENVSVDGVKVTGSSECESVVEIDMNILYEWAKMPEFERRLTRIENIDVRNVSVAQSVWGVHLTGDRRLKPRNIRLSNLDFGACRWRRFEVSNVEGLTYDGLALICEPMLGHGGEDFHTSFYDSLMARVSAADCAADEAWRQADTPAKIAARQQEIRDKTLAAIGGLPERTPHNARVTGVVKKNGYTIEKTLFESRPNFYVTAHVFLPDEAKFPKPWPGVVIPCGHSSVTAKRGEGYQRAAVLAALNGFATLIYDPIDQGERRQKRDDEVGWSSVNEHNDVGVRAMLIGWNTAQFRLWDGMRALDVLADRPDVDGSRLGVMGLSGGGTLTSYIMAFDPRVKAACPGAYLSTVRDVCDNCGPQDAEQNIFGQLAFGGNHLGYVALRAPSPVLMVCSQGDFFAYPGSRETLTNARRIFATLGMPEKINMVSMPGPHHWYESSKLASINWMKRWLCNDTSFDWSRVDDLRMEDIGFRYEANDCGVAYDEPAVYNVTPKGRVMAIEGARNAYDIMAEALAEATAKRAAVTPAIVRDVTGIRPLAELKADVAPRSSRSMVGEAGIRSEAAVLFRRDDRVMIPVLICRPANSVSSAPVLILSDADMRTKESARMRALLDAGRTVAIADLRGFGETAYQRHSFYGASNADEEDAVLMLLLGDSLVARRAEDAALAADFVRQRVGQAPEIIAVGRAAIPAAHAAYLEPSCVAALTVEKAPSSWRELLTEKGVKRNYPFANVIQGALKSYDWTELLSQH